MNIKYPFHRLHTVGSITVKSQTEDFKLENKRFRSAVTMYGIRHKMKLSCRYNKKKKVWKVVRV